MNLYIPFKLFCFKPILLTLSLIGLISNMFLITKADTATEPNVVQITKEALQNSVNAGQNVEFSVTVESLDVSNQNLITLRITDTLPTGFTYNNNMKVFNNDDESANPAPITATTTSAGQVVTLDLNQSTAIRETTILNSGKSFVLSYSAIAPINISAPTNFTNRVCLYYEDLNDSSERELCADKTFTIIPVGENGAGNPTKTPDAGLSDMRSYFIGTTLILIGSCSALAIILKRNYGNRTQKLSFEDYISENI